MPRIGVISDSHGLSEDLLLRAADALRKEGIEQMISLGDGERDGTRLAQLLGDLPLIAVAGNCDGNLHLPREITLNIGGVTLWIGHGDKLAVKTTLLLLEYRAREVGALLALYGHTHRQDLQRVGELMLLNPGALMMGQYAVIVLKNGMAEVCLRKIGR